MAKMGGKIVLAILFLSFAVVANSEDVIELECRDGWTLVDFGCYWLNPNVMPWTTASRVCKSYGGDLAVAKDFFENEDISKVATNNGVDDFWIGAERLDVTANNEVDLNTDGGEQLTVAVGHWFVYEPALLNGKCVHTVKSVTDSLHQWKFGHCERKLPSLCERSVCPKNTFSCVNKKCVSTLVQCDGEDDCGDGSDESNCPNKCSFSWKNSEGSIVHPEEGNGNYSNSQSCAWYIEVPIGYNVEIELESINLEQNSDFIIISGGGLTLEASDEITRQTGFFVGSRKFYSSNNMAIIQFVSDSSISNLGFKLKYKALSAELSVKNHLTATNEKNTLSSPFYGIHQMGTQDYTYVITAENQLGPITLEVVSIDLAEDSMIIIRDGDDVDDGELKTLKGSYKGNGHVVSSRKYMYITIQNIKGHAEGGVTFRYWQGCNFNFEASTGYIVSPGFPASKYPTYVNCQTSVQVPNNARVTLYVESLDLTSSDTLQLYSEGQLSKTFVEGSSEVYHSITSGEFTFKFKSGSVGIANGFNISFSIDCPPLDLNPSESIFNDKNPLLDETAYKQRYYISCRPGSAFAQIEHLNENQVLLTCNAHGSWSVRTSPKCERIYCPMAPIIENGYVSDVNGGLNYGGVITYECQPGYSIIGQAAVDCKLDKSWSAPPRCQSTDCGPASTVLNAEKSVENGVEGQFGSIVRYTCNEGYDIIGTPIRHCVSGGWQGVIPRCDRLTCYADAIKNEQTRTFTAHVNVGESITINCKFGYSIRPEGAANRMTCQNDRTFDQQLTCENINECELDTDNCAQICTDSDPHFECSCNPGYRKNGNVCDNIDECDEAQDKEICEHSCVDKTPFYECTCRTGYVLFKNNGDEGHFLRAGETGRKGDKYQIGYSCVTKQCPAPVVPDNSVLLSQQASYHYGDRITFRCNVGYQTSGQNEMEHSCGSAGTWIGADINCVAITCPIPVVNGLLNAGTLVPDSGFIPFDSELVIRCNRPGFTPQNFDRFRKCTLIGGVYMLDGSDQDHECGFVECGDPANDFAGRFIGLSSRRYGASFTFACQSTITQVKGGSSRYNNATVECLKTGLWDFGSLSCPNVRCEDPGQPKHGHQVDPDYRDRQTLSFTCDLEGYQLSNPTPISCLVDANGNANFNNPVPDCIDTQRPVFTSCQTEVVIPLYSSVGSQFPAVVYKDNGGIKSVSVNPAWPSIETFIASVTQPKSYTFTVTDHAGNSESCVVLVKAQDVTPPTFDCPGTRQRTFSPNQIIDIVFLRSEIINLEDDASQSANINVRFSPPTFKFDASSMRSHSFPPVYDQAVTVYATDEAGNENSCKFNIHFHADVCSPDYVRVPSNSVKTCDANTVGGGYTCTITCNTGYKIYDDPNESSKQVTCTGPGSPFPTTSISCVKIEPSLEGYYKLSYLYRYVPQSGGNLQGCDYSQVITSTLNKEKDELGAEGCKIPFTVYMENLNLNVAQNSLEFLVTVEYNRIPTADYGLCSSVHGLLLDNPNVLSLQELKPLSCPVLTLVSDSSFFNGYFCKHGSEVLKTVGSVSYCMTCPVGTRKDTSSCVPCPIGMFNNLPNQQTCQTCGLDTSTYEEGAISNVECYAKCKAGTISTSGLPPCNNCGKNTFWTSATSCQQCDGDKITRQVGSTSSNQCLSKCPPGTFNAVDGHGTVGFDCKSCPKHSYTDSHGATKCIECATDRFTLNIGSDKSDDCRPMSESTRCQQTCQNGGICRNTVAHTLSCHCSEGWSGEFCQNRLFPCDSHPCLNGGQCNNVVDGYTCSCLSLTEGDNCETIKTSCTADYCQHNGMCENTAQGAVCHCLPGFSGSICQETNDICSSLPCKNGGQCISHDNIRFTCTCLDGFYGKICEENFDDCYTKPCYSGGTCIDELRNSRCNCDTAPGYSGSTCLQRDDPCNLATCGAGTCVPNYVAQGFTCVCFQNAKLQQGSCVVQDFCDPDPCQNNGVCRSAEKTCSCQIGFEGPLCQHDIDDCANNQQCQNSGKCVDRVNGFGCDCTDTGYEGTYCTVSIDHCLLAGCDNQGTQSCNSLFGKCECKPGYQGEKCDTAINECASKPCLHGATCDDLVNDYMCTCPTGWSGRNCETLVTYCTQDLCKNGASCFDVFGNYFCKCLPNTFGANCGESTNVCAVATPCVHGQCNTDTDGQAQCSCQFGFVGDRCQNRIDYCNTDDICHNDGMCMPELDDFECDCKDGFSGGRCSVDTDFCLTTNCPSNARCIDMEDRAYCRCPLQLDGKSCAKAWDQNWDFLFHDPGGIASAYLPYPIRLTSSKFSISLHVKFSQRNGKGTFFSLFTVPKPNSLRRKEKFLHFDESVLTMYTNGEKVEINHHQTYNDGFWHYMVLNVDGDDGVMTVILDTVQSTEVRFTPGTQFDFNIWPVLGCHFDPAIDECTRGGNFHGHLTRVSIYRSTLPFRDVTEIGSKNINAVFDNAILLWAEYIHTRGVSRIAPSNAAQGCPFGFIGYPKCDVRRPGKNIVEVIGGECPKDIIRVSTERLIPIFWDTPSFSGQADVKTKIKRGNVFIWGKYSNIIEARNDDGNAALCLFHIYIQDVKCPALVKPPNVVNQFLKPGDKYSFAGMTCETGYDVSIPSPAIYTCGPTGEWNPLDPFLPYRVSPCGGFSDAIINLGIKLDFTIPSTICDRVVATLISEMKKTMDVIHADWDSICNDADCSNADVSMTCNTHPSLADKTSLVGIIQLSNVKSSLTLRSDVSVTSSITDVLEYLILASNNNVFDYRNRVVDAKPLSHHFTFTQSCLAPRVLQQNHCVHCGPGTYYNTNTKRCHFCPIGQYNPSSGQFECTDCTAGLTTAQVGAVNENECKNKCSKGYYFDVNTCKKCGRGFYQPEEGQFFCFPCSADTTTAFEGTVLKTSCKNSCPNGQQIGAGDSSCEPCPIGYFRTGEPVCQKCDGPFVTEFTGSQTQAECTVVDNPAGTRRLDLTNYEDCPVGTYQPLPHQDNCIPCGDQYLTEQEKSVTKTQCKYFCPAGEQKIVGKDECEKCPQRTYRDGIEPFSNCKPCTGNFISPSPGATSADQCSLFHCDAGSEPNANNNGCDICPRGKYQPMGGQNKCLACEDGTSTLGVGTKLKENCLNYCSSGQERKPDGTCENCPLGTYKNNAEDLLGGCKPCPDPKFTTSETGSISVDSCSVLHCDLGDKADYVLKKCTPCEKGTYQDEKMKDTCKSCSDGLSTRSEGSKKIGDCEFYCPSGKEKKGSQCDPCPRGTYKDNAMDKFMECKACHIDFTTAKDASESENACDVPNCPPGQFIDGIKCSRCAKGSYQDEKWQEQCKPCGEHRSTSGEGADSLTDCFLECPAGKENPSNTDDCNDCARGYYKSTAGINPCVACANLDENNIRISKDPGAASSSECAKLVCLPGYFPGSTFCEKCDYGSYQPLKWEDKCLECGTGRTTYVKGATAPSECWLDCQAGKEYRQSDDTCQPCPIGFYNDDSKPDVFTCTKCHAGFITGQTGAESVSLCNVVDCSTPGTYRDSSTNRCKDCPIGQYQDIPRQTSCQGCNTGYTTRSTGSESSSKCLRDCPAGTEVKVFEASQNCEPCQIGYYRSGDTWECQRCPQDLTTKYIRSVSADECSVSTCESGFTYNKDNKRCEICPANTYQEERGNVGSCTPCPDGKTTIGEGSKFSNLCLSLCDLQASCNKTSQNCVHDSTKAEGYRCDCKADYHPVLGVCKHKCLSNYCGSKGTCESSPVQCVCQDGYSGTRCEERPDAETVSAQVDKNTLIGVVVAVGVVLFAIVLITALCMSFKHKREKKRAASTLDDRESIATRSEIPNFGMKPSNSIRPPQSFNNSAYYVPFGNDPAVYTA